MEMYTGAEHRATETYMIPGTGSNPNPTYLPQLEEIGYMSNEMAPEFIVDQGVYYPTANYYGYYSTGFESPSEWDDHSRFLGLDGQDVHYSGLQTESLPYTYYTPSYGYTQSPYNPYNPYIPGAAIGIDGPYAGTQQYFSSPPYQPPAYIPVVVQPGTDANPNSTLDPSLFSTGASMASSAHINTGGVKYTPPLSSERSASRNLTSETSQPSHASLVNVRNSSGLAQTANQFSHGRVPSVQNPLKVTVSSNDGFTHFGSTVRGWATQDRFRPRSQLNGVANNATGGTDVLGEQNKGPRTSRSKGQWTSALANGAYASKVGSSNAQRNIVINADQYNRDDFPVNYPNAKFFVIKSYSEDDVHKSIKYNVWSSTPNGNKKLGNAYEDAQKISVGKPINCPIFLFFSVNASGQFCGVSEMIGPVDFQKDMDFWQQDKWTGSFPVKWHIIKDVPNTSFRHIILENNENKPVTNSRDTQEILYLPGMNMLNIFKSSHLKTSILDDFMFYEERERIMQEEKFRILGRCYDASHFLPAVVPVHKTDTIVQPPKADEEQSNGKVNELPKAYEKLVCGASGQPSIAVGKQSDGLIDQPTKTDGKRHNGTVNQPLKAAGKLPNGAVDQPLRTDGRPPNGAVDQPPEDGKPSDGTVDQPPIAVIKPANRTVDQPPKAYIVPTKLKNPKSTVDQPPRAGRSPSKPKDPKSMGVSPLKADMKDPTSTGDEHLRADKNPGKPTDLKSTGKTGTNVEQVTRKSHLLKSSDDNNNASGPNSVMIGSSSVDSKEGEASSSAARVVESTPTDVVTVGSMRIKVIGLGESSPSSSIITVGDIPIEPKGLKLNKQGTSAGSRPHQK